LSVFRLDWKTRLSFRASFQNLLFDFNPLVLESILLLGVNPLALGSIRLLSNTSYCIESSNWILSYLIKFCFASSFVFVRNFQNLLFEFNPLDLDSIFLLYNTSYCIESNQFIRSNFDRIADSLTSLFVGRISIENYRPNFLFSKSCCLNSSNLICNKFASFPIPPIVGNQAIYFVLFDRSSDLLTSLLSFEYRSNFVVNFVRISNTRTCCLTSIDLLWSQSDCFPILYRI